MRSPYMDILEAAGVEPKEFELPSKYEAGVAATCVRSLAVSYGMENVQVRLLRHVLFIWIGAAHKLKFMPPPFPKMGPRRKVGRPLGSLGRKGPQRETAGIQTSGEKHG